MDIQKENDLLQEAFEVVTDEMGFCLDQKWGDYENPYENSDTALAFNLFKKGWQAKSQAVPEGFVLVEASEFESLKSDNEHFTKSCIDWTDRAYKQRAKVDHIKNEVERFKQSGTNLDLSRFLDNLIAFSTFKYDKEFDGFVLVPRELSDEEARKHAEAMFNKVEHMARYEQRDLSESEFESFKNRWIDARTLTIQFDWKAMIEAQEQSQ